MAEKHYVHLKRGGGEVHLPKRGSNQYVTPFRSSTSSILSKSQPYKAPKNAEQLSEGITSYYRKYH